MLTLSLFFSGVLWSGDHPFEGVVETLQLLRLKGWAIFFSFSFQVPKS